MRRLFVIVLLLTEMLFAGDLKPIALPTPQTDGGRPLMQALKERHTSREFAPGKLPLQLVSNLLWAAFGVNRADGRRTAPSSWDWQEIDIYVFTPDATYVYDAKANQLLPVVARDLRALTGTQSYVATAPLNLVYIADHAKAKRGAVKEADFYSAAHTGFIGQNVYLFCASEGLACGIRSSVDKEALGAALKLRPEQKIILGQAVGYPKK